MAKYWDVEQNTEEWHRLRLGIPCSSEFHRILTPKKLEISKQAAPYMYRLLYEWIAGEPCENAFASQWMDRGHELEDQAFRAYEMFAGIETERGGFVTTDDGMIGCSPDRLVGKPGDLELKCPLGPTQVEYALTGIVADEYMTQLQGRLMIHGREWVDIFPYHPKLALPPTRVTRDEEYIKTLSGVMARFVETMLARREDLEKRFGPFTRPERDPEQVEEGLDWLGVSEAEIEQDIAERRAAGQWANAE